MYTGYLTVAVDTGLVGRVLFQRLMNDEQAIRLCGHTKVTHVNSLFRICLLDDTNGGICNENKQDDQGLDECASKT